MMMTIKRLLNVCVQEEGGQKEICILGSDSTLLIQLKNCRRQILESI